MIKNKIFTYYLPQFHSIKENNEWWGEGFNEWTNVKSYNATSNEAKPLDLGFYHLDDVSIIEKQYALARKAGIDSFCFWTYWFDTDEKIMESPIKKLLESDVDVEYCISWANHSWFNKKKGLLLKEQKYNSDYAEFFNYLLPFFKDERYTKISDKPVLFIFDIESIPNFEVFKTEFDKLAIVNGFSGIYIISENCNSKMREDKDISNSIESRNILNQRKKSHYCRDALIYFFAFFNIHITRKYDYSTLVSKFNSEALRDDKVVPVILPRWNSSIRHGRGGWKMENESLDSFESHVRNTVKIVQKRNFDDRIVLVKSWNEWAEGNYMEPCKKHGSGYINIMNKYFGG